MASSVSRHCYRILLRLYPTPFRAANGSDMEAVFLASLRMQREKWGRFGLLFGWTRILWDTAWHGIRLRLKGDRTGRASGPMRPGRTRRVLRSLWEDASFAARHLARNRGFTVTAVGVLTLGIGLNAAVFGAVHSLLMRPLPGVRDPAELVHVYRSRGLESRFLPSSIPLFRDLRANTDVFSGMAAWTFSYLNASTEAGSERVLGQVVSSEFFQLFGVPMIHGRGFSEPGGDEGREERVIVVSEGYWRSRLGGIPDVVGRTVGINGNQWEVIGVAAKEFRGPIPLLTPSLWGPLSMHAELMRNGDQSENRRNNFLGVVARLKPGSDLEGAEEWTGQFATRLQERFPEIYERTGIRLHPLGKAGLHPAIRSAQAGLSGVVMAVVALLLIIACVNVASLFLAKSQPRRREVAVRRSLGASRGRLVSQLLMESLLLSLIAGAMGFLLATVAVEALNRIRIPIELALEWDIGMGGPAVAFTLGVTLLTSLIFGLAPALRSSGPDLLSSLKEGGRSGDGKPDRSGQLLIGVQVAVSTLLLVCAGLFATNLKNAVTMDTGFSHENLVLATLDPGLHGFDPDATEGLFSDLIARVRAFPGVESAGLGRSLPLGIEGAQRLIEVPGYEPAPGESMNIQYNIVDPGYFPTMGIPIVEGRGFLESHREEGEAAAVVNERFAERFWPGESPLGKALREGGREWVVVGVVPTGKYQRLAEEAMPFLYLPWPNLRSSEMKIHIRTAADPSTIVPSLRREVGMMAPGLPLFGVKTMRDHLSFSLLPARLGAIVLGIFGGVCVLLLSVGIHGVVAFSVSQRTREVGIRVAMGADPRNATALVFGEEARVIISGVVIGILAALAASRWMESVLYSGDALDPAVFVGAPLLLMAVAGVASYLPARRAARIDPAQALREE